MTTNIIEAVQQRLEYPSLQKVDPNIHETKDKYPPELTQKLAQATIPAILTAFYRLTRTEGGSEKLLSTSPTSNWLNVLYNDKKEEAVEKLAQYAGVSASTASVHMENVADESAVLIRELSGQPATADKIKTYMNSQRHHILVYLPPALNMGDILNDEGLDDRTNKMEGPISNFMHKIENNFSGGQ